MSKKYSMYVETDDDFSIVYNGHIYDGDFHLYFDSVDQLDQLEVCAPYGSTHTEHTKSSEFFEALKAIKEDPKKPYNSIGGNRGIWWHFEDEDKRNVSDMQNWDYDTCKKVYKSLVYRFDSWSSELCHDWLDDEDHKDLCRMLASFCTENI